MTEVPADRDHGAFNPARKLTLCYLLALSLVAVFVVGSQIWLQQTMAEMEENARVINVAGRQRMLSQKISKAVLLTERTQDPGEKQDVLRELDVAFTEWKDAHHLLTGSYQFNGALRQSFASLGASYAAMSSVATSVLANGGAVSDDMIRLVTANEAKFLSGMEEIVGLYEQEVYRLGSLRDMEMLMAAIALLILLFEALFVFRPLTALIMKQFDAIRQSHAKIAQAREKAEQASLSKTRFISYFSHEIRNPIGAISGFAEILMNSDMDAARKQQFTRLIVDNCEHLTKITGDAIDAALIETGNLKLIPAGCDPREVVRGVTLLMEEAATRKNIHLALQVVEPLPAEIRTDVTRFRQILINLVSNAIKFTSSGGVYIRLEAAGQDHLAVAVIDSGEGMSRSQMKLLFQFFNRLKLVGNETGSGIGLAVSKQLARCLGGDLTVSSLPGQGSTFRFTVATNLNTSADIQQQSSVAR